MAKVHYALRLQSGEVFESSEAYGEPVDLSLFPEDGEETPFPEKVMLHLVKLSPGEKSSLSLDADDAYGQRDENLVFSVEKRKLPKNLVPEVGGGA